MEVWVRQGMGYRPDLNKRMPFPVPGWMWDSAVGQDLYDQRINYMRRVDELGFDGLIFTEHHYGPNGGLTPSPNLMMATAAQVTSNIKLVTMGIILSLHGHPVRVAEEMAMLDNLSHGRVVAGFITGNPEAHYAFSMPGQEGRARHREAFDLIKRSWTDENPFEWHGDYFNYDCVSIIPRPVQTPHPPIWTTAGSAESLEWAATRRVSMIASGPLRQAAETLDYFQQTAEADGWTPTIANRGMSREFFLAPTIAEVRDVAENVILRDRADAYSPEFETPRLDLLHKAKYTERSYTFLSAPRAQRVSPGGANLEGMMESGSYLIGDPDTITQQIIRHHKELNTSVLVIRPEMSMLPLSKAQEMLELFASEVLPEIRKL